MERLKQPVATDGNGFRLFSTPTSQMADLQAFPLSPLTDSNRRPTPLYEEGPWIK
jgi:hypothetical protein